jgi:hypothetical protein
MKAGISSIWFIGLVITFLMVFSAYIIITVDYSKSFKLKNEVLTIIEKNKGMTLYNNGTVVPSTVFSGNVTSKIGAIKTINAYLKASGYTAKGPCNRAESDTYVFGVKELYYEDGRTWSDIGERVTDSNKAYYYCFAKYPTGNIDNKVYDSVYYGVELFYRFEIPILREFLPIRIEGVTDEIYRPDQSHEPNISDCSGKGICRNSVDYFISIGG